MCLRPFHNMLKIMWKTPQNTVESRHAGPECKNILPSVYFLDHLVNFNVEYRVGAQLLLDDLD